jgi:hypothetical protein
MQGQNGLTRADEFTNLSDMFRSHWLCGRDRACIKVVTVEAQWPSARLGATILRLGSFLATHMAVAIEGLCDALHAVEHVSFNLLLCPHFRSYFCGTSVCRLFSFQD